MKKHFLHVIIFGLISLFGISATAQITLGGIRNKAENSLGNAIDNKIQQEMDKAAQRVVDKYWDRVIGKYYGGLYENESSSATSSKSSSKSAYPFTMSSDATLEDTYSFDNSIRMQIDTYKKNGKLDETVFIKTYTKASANYIGTSIEDPNQKSKDQEFFIINDFGNETMVMLTENDGEKMRVAFSFKLDEEALAKMAEEEEGDEKKPTPNFEEIGSKTILGYKCKGYKMEDEDAVSEVWISEKPITGMEKATGMLGKNMQNSNVTMPAGYPKGSMMETESYNKKTKEKFIMKVTEINTNDNKSFDMDDYPDSMAAAQNE